VQAHAVNHTFCCTTNPSPSAQDKRKANEDIMQALDRERQQALAEQQRAMGEHLAELEAERQHQANLAAQLSETQVGSSVSEVRAVWQGSH
jgi:hypothetical protein